MGAGGGDANRLTAYRGKGRPKGAAHERKKMRDLTFTIQWSEAREAFLITDESGYVLASSNQRDKALAAAKRDAELASHAGARVTVNIKGRDGKLKTECVFSCRSAENS